MFKEFMRTILNKDEILIKKGGANLEVGIETVGGHLYLTTYRLIFEPHKLNFNRKCIEIMIDDIEEIEKKWSKLFYIIPIYPNALSVYTVKREYIFIVFSNKKWANSINRLI